ncbi:low-density lipoprotein receptor-related protein 2-like isoform X1 [Crassostrea virginica]
MMSFFRLVLAICFIISFGYYGLGIQGDKGLILGLWNPATILKFTEIPTDSTSNFNQISHPLEPSSATITSMVFDPNKAVLFMACSSTIYMVTNFSMWQNKAPTFSIVYTGKSRAFGQIAFDFVSKNLYWCDSLLHWIAMKPAYTYDTIQKVVVEDELNDPQGLALDPEDGLMFFSDNGLHPRIERASLDGRDRTVIVYRGLLNVVALSVDAAYNKLYWSDVTRQTLEISDYDGSNRRVITRMNEVIFMDLLYYENLLYAVDARYRALYGFDPLSGITLFTRKIDSGQPYTVNVYDTKIRFQKDNPCSDLDCDHMCVNTKPEPKCMCADGFLLDYDDETCTEKYRFFERGFLVNNESMFAMHEVHSLNGQQRKIRQSKMFSNIETFAVDAKTDIIYFLESRQNSLKKLDMISMKTSTLTSSLSGRDLTFDWIENRLGWIETESRIKIYNIEIGTSYLIYENFQNLTSLTVDAHNSVLYWISGPFGSRTIIRGTWKSDTPDVVLSEANLYNPVSLQYDVTSDRLYWLDESQIKSSTTNGLDIRSHILAIGALKAFAYKEFLGWITGDKIYFMRQSLNTTEHVFYTVKNAKEVVVFDADLQKDKRESCHIRNGGCQDICIPSNNKRQCKCDIGLKIKNESTCNREILRTEFIIVTDFSHKRLLQISIQNGSIVKLPINVKSPGMAVDKTAKKLYFTDIEEKTIQVSTLFGENTSTFYATGFEHADRIAIDHSTGNVYYSAIENIESKGYIRVVHKTAYLHKTVLFHLVYPRDIVLHPSKGFLFWTEFNKNPSIGRSYMDGTARTFITTKDLVWPNGLAIDFESHLLYWTDGSLNRIEVSDLNGGNRRVLATDTDAHLMSIGIHGQYLYYTAWKRQRITKMDKTTGSKISFMDNYPELGRIDSMDIFAEYSIDVSTSCSNKNGFCSTFCFPTPFGRTCGCQDNVSLQSDQLTCQGVLRCSTSHQNVKFLDCLPYPGQSCAFKCNPGYRSTVDTTISCLPDGHWAPSIDTVCEVILCPPLIANGRLAPDCSRQIGTSCSFTCDDSYKASILPRSITCSSGAVWDKDVDELCILVRCSTSHQNLKFLDCLPYPGQSCAFKCNPGYRSTVDTTISCLPDGHWAPSIDTVCEVSLCPPLITNVRLAPDCSRQIGTSCSFTCDDSYKASVLPMSITCSSGAVWNKEVDELCIPIQCPLEIPSGRLSSLCRGLVGEICALHCDDESMASVHVVCLPTGLWDVEIGAICIPGSRSEKEKGQDDAGNNMDLYAVALISGATVIILFLLQNRRQ